MYSKKIIIGTLLIIAAGAWTYKNKTDESKPTIRISRIESGKFNDKITLEGIVTPEKEETIFAPIPVVIDKVDSKVGARVEVGDIILSFTGEAKREIEKILEELRIQVNIGEALLETLKRQVKNAGFEVELTAQQAKVNKTLLSQDAISSLEVAKSETMANRANSEYEDLKARQLVETQKQLLLKEKKKELERKIQFIVGDLKSPINGIITELPVEKGSILKDGQKIVTIAQEGSYKIKIEAPANLITSIEVGSDASVRDLANSTIKNYKGKVSKVSRVARDDLKKQKIIDVEIELENGEGLNSGFFTVVEIGGGVPNIAKMADAFSILEESGNHYVYMVEEGTVIKVPVDIGMRTASKYEITNLPEGTEIVVNPSRVKPGQQVRVGES